jgi:hypothetical protein
MLINNILFPIFVGNIHANEDRLKESDTIKDVVAFLRLLIKGNGTDQMPPIFIGNNQVKQVSAGLSVLTIIVSYIQ